MSKLQERERINTAGTEKTLIENKPVEEVKHADEKPEAGSFDVNQAEMASIDSKLSKRKAKAMRRAQAAADKLAEESIESAVKQIQDDVVREHETIADATRIDQEQVTQEAEAEAAARMAAQEEAAKVEAEAAKPEAEAKEKEETVRLALEQEAARTRMAAQEEAARFEAETAQIAQENEQEMAAKLEAERVAKEVAAAIIQPIDIGFKSADEELNSIWKEAEASISAKDSLEAAAASESVPLPDLSISLEEDKVITAANPDVPTMTVEDKPTKCACIIL